jgi:outer membrane lipoprotein-sorting protein
MTRWLPLALLALLLTACTSCGGVPRPRYPHSQPLQALTLHRLVREQVPSIRAEARVEQRGNEGRIKGTVYLLVQRPSRVRFDVMTQFGPIAILTSDGERFAYSDLRSKRFMTGVTCPANIARLLNVSLSAEQTVLLLLGGTPVLEHTKSSVDWDSEGFYRFVLHAADGQRQEVDLKVPAADLELPTERQRLVLLRSELFDSRGRSVWRATYDDYRRLSTGGVTTELPYSVDVVQKTAGTETRIRFKEVTVDTELPGDAFTQMPAPGMTIEEAVCP